MIAAASTPTAMASANDEQATPPVRAASAAARSPIGSTQAAILVRDATARAVTCQSAIAPQPTIASRSASHGEANRIPGERSDRALWSLSTVKRVP